MGRSFTRERLGNSEQAVQCGEPGRGAGFTAFAFVKRRARHCDIGGQEGGAVHPERFEMPPDRLAMAPQQRPRKTGKAVRGHFFHLRRPGGGEARARASDAPALNPRAPAAYQADTLARAYTEPGQTTACP